MTTTIVTTSAATFIAQILSELSFVEPVSFGGASRLRCAVEECVVRAGTDDVSVYRLHHIGACGVWRQRQHLVERIQLELIVQRSDTGRSARWSIADDAAS